jgi:NADPH:quinone reductase
LFALAYRALFIKANSKPGDVVLINGASGGVGIPTVQIAKACGLKVIGTAGNDDNLKLIKQQGVDHAFNYRDPSYLDEIKKIYPNGLDLIVEMQAAANLVNDIKILKPLTGRVVIVGSRGQTQIDPAVFIFNEATVVGLYVNKNSDEDISKASDLISRLLNENKIKPLLGPKYQLKDAPLVHERLETASLGRIVLFI